MKTEDDLRRALAEAAAALPAPGPDARLRVARRVRRYRLVRIFPAIASVAAMVAVLATVAHGLGTERDAPSVVKTGQAPTSATPPIQTTAPATSAPTTTGPATHPPTLGEMTTVMARTVEVTGHTEHFIPGALAVTVPDGTGGTLTAVGGQRFPTADAKGQLVFFWHNDTFVGWDGDAEVNQILSIQAAGNAITVTYAHYAVTDALCCPSLPPLTAVYHWAGRIVSTGTRPSEAGDAVKVVLLP